MIKTCLKNVFLAYLTNKLCTENSKSSQILTSDGKGLNVIFNIKVKENIL